MTPCCTLFVLSVRPHRPGNPCAFARLTAGSHRHHALAAHPCLYRFFVPPEESATLLSFTPDSQLSLYARREMHAWGAHGLLRVFSGRNNRITQTRSCDAA